MITCSFTSRYARRSANGSYRYLQALPFCPPHGSSSRHSTTKCYQWTEPRNGERFSEHENSILSGIAILSATWEPVVRSPSVCQENATNTPTPKGRWRSRTSILTTLERAFNLDACTICMILSKNCELRTECTKGGNLGTFSSSSFRKR